MSSGFKYFKGLLSHYKTEPMICVCYHCGFIWISNVFNRCHFCGHSNYKVVPIRDHPGFCFEWLESNGFPYLRECLEVECIC